MADGHNGSGALQHELVILGLDVLNAVGIICNFIRPSLDNSTLEDAIFCAYDVFRRPLGIPKKDSLPHSAVRFMSVAFVGFQYEIHYFTEADDEVFALV